VTLCQEAGWSVAVNRPFAGALVPIAYFGSDARVRAVMIEVSRRLYLDEQTGAAGADFERCRARLSGVLHRLIDTGATINSDSPECGLAGVDNCAADGDGSSARYGCS
jgi:N-formylglutamate amidohydrolase